MLNVRQREALVTAALIAALILTALLAVRAAGIARSADRNNEPLRPWMSIRYIAHSYHVSPELLWEALGLPSSPRDHRPLRAIAHQQHRSVEDVLQKLKTAITDSRSKHPPAPEPPH